MNATQTRVLDVIKVAGQSGISHFDIESATFRSGKMVNHNTLRRVTQELRKAGLIESIGFRSHYGINEKLFVPTVRPTPDAQGY